jgi:molybdenum cofactor cytidylyltransferase
MERNLNPAGPDEPRAGELRLFALVLAAGRSTRFGEPKQLAPFGGMPLVTRAVRLAEAVCGTRSLLVAGHEWPSVVAACRPLEGFFANNTRHGAGLGASIACGIRSVSDAADAVLLLLADQPLISEAHLLRLKAAWLESQESIVVTAFAGTTGPPVLFPARDFADLAALDGDSGARRTLARAGSRVRHIEFEDALVDVDRVSDLEELQQRRPVRE